MGFHWVEHTVAVAFERHSVAVAFDWHAVAVAFDWHAVVVAFEQHIVAVEGSSVQGIVVACRPGFGSGLRGTN